jgi:hypothetical protein
MSDANRSFQKGNALTGPYIYPHPGVTRRFLISQQPVSIVRSRSVDVRRRPLPLLRQTTEFLPPGFISNNCTYSINVLVSSSCSSPTPRTDSQGNRSPYQPTTCPITGIQHWCQQCVVSCIQRSNPGRRQGRKRYTGLDIIFQKTSNER